MRKLFGSLSIQHKYSLFFILLILLPVLGCMAFLFKSSNDVMLDQEYRNRLELLSAISSGIDTQLKTVETGIRNLYNYSDLFSQEANYSGTRRALISYFERNPCFAAFQFYSIAGFTYASIRNEDDAASHFLKSIGPQWIEELKEANGKTVWFLPAEEQRVFLCGALIKNITSFHEPMGYAFYYVDPSYLNGVFDHLLTSDNDAISVHLSSGERVWSREQPWSKDVLWSGDAFPHANGYSVFSHGGTDIFSVYIRSEQTDWIYVSSSLLSNIHVLNDPFFLYFGITAAVLLLSLLAGMRAIHGSIIRPIRKIVVTLNMTHAQGMRTIEYASNDEIGALCRSYNELIARIRQLIQDNEAAHRNELEQELNALQAQINPHFLYNTLDSIAWLARSSNAPEVTRLLVLLSRSLRYSISPHERYARLEEEFHWIKEYIHLQQTRFPGLFRAEYDIDGQVLAYGTFRLVLEPFVENSIVHGFGGMQSGGVLTIRAKMGEGDILLAVEDNGVGISSSRHRELTAHLEQGIGIYNVHRRIRLRFGEQFGVTIQAGENGGTRVQMRLPILTLTDLENFTQSA